MFETNAASSRRKELPIMFRRIFMLALLIAAIAVPLATRTPQVAASSHREAPLISQDPLADNTDVYAFVSPDRPDTVTIIANYIPMEEPAGGPTFFNFDPNVLYSIYVDNTGDGEEDVTFDFKFKTTIANPNTFLTHLGTAGQGGGDAVISSLDDADFNVKQTYTVSMTRESTPYGKHDKYDKRDKPEVLGSNLLVPPYNIGPGATPNYASLAAQAVYNLPSGIQVFAGPRDDPFFVDLGAVFDRLELRPLGIFGDPRGRDSVAGFNVHSICLQVPISMLTSNGQKPVNPTAKNAVVGIWAASSRPQISILRNDGTLDTNGKMVQVSRLGNPLVNELFSPLKQRDRWNATDPSDDIQYRQTQVVTPEVPALVDLLYGTNTPSSGAVVRALKPFPTTNRTDLELILYRGIPVNGITGPNFTTVIGGDLNKAAYADQLRLNLAIPPNVMGGLPDMNNPGDRRLGVLGGDAAGFPNGRRLFDDVVDVFLRAGAGGTPFTSVLFPDFSGQNDPNTAPNNVLSDGVDRNPEGYLPAFPYLQTPISGFDAPHAVVVP